MVSVYEEEIDIYISIFLVFGHQEGLREVPSMSQWIVVDVDVLLGGLGRLLHAHLKGKFQGILSILGPRSEVKRFLCSYQYMLCIPPRLL